MVGGFILNCKGVNVLDVVLLLVVLLDKDRDDLEFVCELGVDWLVLFFVQCVEDVIEVCELVKGCVVIFFKIEKFVVVCVFSEILKVLDGIMVVWGDLGVELLVYFVLLIQKCLMWVCCVVVKLVIVVMQMLELMIESLMLICVEVLDVVIVIYEGVDVIMLLVESVVGVYLIEVVVMMDNVVCLVELDLIYLEIIESLCVVKCQIVVDVIVVVVCEIVEMIDIFVICVYILLGIMVSLMVCECLCVLIIVLIFEVEMLWWLCLIWGMYCVLILELVWFKQVVVNVVKVVCDFGFVNEMNQIVVMVGVFFNQMGMMNILCIVFCDECLIYCIDLEQVFDLNGFVY